MRHRLSVMLAPIVALTPLPAAAEVATSSDSGFVSHNVAEVSAPPAEAWAMLVRPGEWWNGEHSFSGSAANMTIAPVAGGCFCEAIPAGNGGAAGQVEHMRVVYIDPRVHTLRLRGALGPLQSEAVTAVLTMSVEASGSGSRITWDYVVGGYMRMAMGEMAPAVDGVVGEQLSRLADRLGRP